MPAGMRAGPDSLANAQVSCRLRSDGRLSVLDLESGTVYEGLNHFVDGGDAGDEYNYSPPAEDQIVAEPVAAGTVRCLQDGRYRGVLEVQVVYRVPARLEAGRRQRSGETVELPITVRVSLDAESSQLDLEVELENRAEDHRLRVHFPLPFVVSASTADGAYHVTRRSVRAAQREAQAHEWELPTYPMRTFVEVADAQCAFALITEGLHEYEVLDQRPARLALTLVRAVGWLSRDDLAYRAGHAGPGLPTPGAQVPGRHHFRYSLRFERKGGEKAGLWRQAEATTVPLELAALWPGGGEPAPGPARIELEPASLQMTACVPTPDGFVLRLLNASERDAQAHVVLNPPPAEVLRTTLAGSAPERLLPDVGAYRLRLRAWEIATIRVLR